jgi:hypothetical protein
MPASVLALLLLTEARRPARLDEHGDVVTLDQQNRARWDAAAIARGIALLNDSLRRSHGQADAYRLQAAIAAEHARAAIYHDTDWAEILRLYDLLVSIAPSHAASLDRVVAATEAADPATGLAMLAELLPSPRWHAVRAELLAREARHTEAARELAESPPRTGKRNRNDGIGSDGERLAMPTRQTRGGPEPPGGQVSPSTGLPCSPRPGRPMKEWVRIPAGEESWLSYLLEARTFVPAVAGAGPLGCP